MKRTVLSSSASTFRVSRRAPPDERGAPGMRRRMSSWPTSCARTGQRWETDRPVALEPVRHSSGPSRDVVRGPSDLGERAQLRRVGRTIARVVPGESPPVAHADWSHQRTDSSFSSVVRAEPSEDRSGAGSAGTAAAPAGEWRRHDRLVRAPTTSRLARSSGQILVTVTLVDRSLRTERQSAGVRNRGTRGHELGRRAVGRGSPCPPGRLRVPRRTAGRRRGGSPARAARRGSRVPGSQQQVMVCSAAGPDRCVPAPRRSPRAHRDRRGARAPRARGRGGKKIEEVVAEGGGEEHRRLPAGSRCARAVASATASRVSGVRLEAGEALPEAAPRRGLPAH